MLINGGYIILIAINKLLLYWFPIDAYYHGETNGDLNIKTSTIGIFVTFVTEKSGVATYIG